MELTKKSDKDFEKFKEALVDTGQDHLVRELLGGQHQGILLFTNTALTVILYNVIYIRGIKITENHTTFLRIRQMAQQFGTALPEKP